MTDDHAQLLMTPHGKPVVLRTKNRRKMSAEAGERIRQAQINLWAAKKKSPTMKTAPIRSLSVGQIGAHGRNADGDSNALA
jgi:hypothetical protein